MSVQRKEDTFLEDRKHLEKLSDQEIHDRFWALTDEIIAPLIDLAKKNTTPSVERSVLLRLGFSSIEAKALVEKVMDYGLMPKGAGHVVYVASKENNVSIKEAGFGLIEGKYWDSVTKYFKEGK
ncbi:D-ornithine 4,5-aminomutase subunit alpha [Bacilli bacterium PM5-3]|nr:D-ornithine 4,5-aminomutase subunit alpha [Bacilli bacterium PM5-3]MDH6603637.1 D-ornithine 4,5-aminomutase subunit alpha [Bacilli bacterium PM5-9]